jgi:hypothetical protein
VIPLGGLVHNQLLQVTSSLNSTVYACFGICIVSPFMVTAIIRHPWKTKFRGKLTDMSTSRHLGGLTSM